MAAKKRPLKPITLDSMNEDYSSLQYIGNLALQTAPDHEEHETRQKRERKPQLHIVPKQQKKPVVSHQKHTKIQFKKGAKLKLVLFVAGVMIGGMLLVNKQANIAQNNSLISSKETELENLRRQSEQLEIEYAMTDDLNTVMAIASTELGMGIPQEDMRKEIVLNDRVNSDAVEAEADTQIGESVLSAMFEKITDNMR